MKLKRYLAAIVCSLLMLTACAPKQAERNTSSDTGSSVIVSGDDQSSQLSHTESSAGDSEDSSEESIVDGSKQGSEQSSYASAAVQTSDLIESPLYSTAVLYCVDDGKYIYSDAQDKRIAPASITKLLTAAVVLKYMDPDEVVTVGTELALVNEGSSVCWLDVGHRLTVRDLLTGMLLSSGNDAAYTAAVSAARKTDPSLTDDEDAVAAFCALMNTLAAEIGMTDSHFSDPDGWDEDDHYVTAADLVRLSVYVLNDPVIREITAMHQKDVEFVSGESITWTNTNSLLDPESSFYCDSAIGLKTGTTDNAGCCLAAAFEKNGKTYVTVVSGCAESDERYELTLKLYDRIA